MLIEPGEEMRQQMSASWRYSSFHSTVPQERTKDDSFFLKRRIELEVYYAPVLVCLYPLQSCRLIECDGEAIFQQLLVVLSSSAFFFFPRPFRLFLLPSTPLRVLERTIRIPPGRHESILFAYRYLPPQEITSYQPSSSPLSTALAAALLSLYFLCGHIYM